MVNRYICTVLEEARDALKKLNWVSLPIVKRHLGALIEEMQSIASKMESSLYDNSDYERIRGELKKEKHELKILHLQKEQLERDIELLGIRYAALSMRPSDEIEFQEDNT